ncbi:two pore domain potassium channel family protein [Bacillus mangrovi]|uniref:Two pore domain potassium channel family protein n=1 Tax=Metabacillus mangrovi TaxID=1491830 RepID=A0A7X2S9L3_9BACI|nr:potassium channel family protein [Metabacillus mangrovi]MTH55703.1 two pore domain potassium channel family protein [Metabacillus mangrovi]
MEIIIAAATLICLGMSVRITAKTFKEQQFLSRETILVIAFLYLSILIGFAMLYLLFIQSGYPILTEDRQPIKGDYLEHLNTSLYFSAVTLFSVGYGEIIPVGAGRLLAVAEALIGYMLPVILVARTVMEIEKNPK